MLCYLRYLRIAFSATCLIACGLLVALSIRSNHQADVVRGKLFVPYEVISVRGRLMLTQIDNRKIPALPRVESFPVGKRQADIVDNQVRSFSNFQGFGLDKGHSILLPHWFAAVLLLTLAALPWISPRYALRTLLVATTFVAIALATIVALSR